ncbi:DUF6159 family protein [Luteimonas sp. 8-5]|uniref:DUF6159 family protein n=1 Tax=Luteimonas sp. 8-5 TaxID=3039387 RepID=UPI0024372722|nr:DUF6159 family protein [Luteimonas sp. 8-5]MDG6349412.1 DUF6159 family protein [Luteimonas sp. 8-5]
MGKFSRSWALAKASMAVLRSDKELLVFPLVSTAVTVIVAATFILPMFGLGMFRNLEAEGGGMPAMFYPWLFCFYLVQYFVIFFFNTALVGAAMIRLDGGDPTVSDGLRIARGKWTTILGYAAIAATVGMLLRALEQRAGIVGRIVIGLIGVAWTVATYLTVPVLVARDVGPIEAVKESASLLKATWGENIIGNGGIGLVFTIANVVLVLVCGALVVFLAVQKLVVLATVVAALAVLAVMLMALVQAALSGIYSAALYRYAVQGDAASGFDGVILRDAFQRKL